jgi:hypothetical protein
MTTGSVVIVVAPAECPSGRRPVPKQISDRCGQDGDGAELRRCGEL